MRDFNNHNWESEIFQRENPESIIVTGNYRRFAPTSKFHYIDWLKSLSAEELERVKKSNKYFNNEKNDDEIDMDN